MHTSWKRREEVLYCKKDWKNKKYLTVANAVSDQIISFIIRPEPSITSVSRSKEEDE